MSELPNDNYSARRASIIKEQLISELESQHFWLFMVKLVYGLDGPSSEKLVSISISLVKVKLINFLSMISFVNCQTWTLRDN